MSWGYRCCHACPPCCSNLLQDEGRLSRPVAAKRDFVCAGATCVFKERKLEDDGVGVRWRPPSCFGFSMAVEACPDIVTHGTQTIKLASRGPKMLVFTRSCVSEGFVSPL